MLSFSNGNRNIKLSANPSVFCGTAYYYPCVSDYSLMPITTRNKRCVRLRGWRCAFRFEAMGSNQIIIQFDGCLRAYTFNARRQIANACNIRCSEIKLRAIVVEGKGYDARLRMFKEHKPVLEFGRRVMEPGFLILVRARFRL